MAAKYMVAIQLSREPLVRSCMRETYFERAKITIKPTKKGIKEIDENHPCYRYAQCCYFSSYYDVIVVESSAQHAEMLILLTSMALRLFM